MSINEEMLFQNYPVRETDELFIRRATPQDVDAILSIAASVGKARKQPDRGFLIDDYTKDHEHHRSFFSVAINSLDYFYLAEKNNTPIGFLMAYTNKQWLDVNPNWLFETNWIPTFNKNRLKKFILIEKTAVKAGLTGKGIGSALYSILIRDIRKCGYRDIFSETIIAPKPNLASLEFRRKQQYRLVGTRFEVFKGEVFTDLVYHKYI